MQDAMVTARMSQAKKEAGNRVLESLGTNTSQFINDMYDYLIEHGSSPVAQGSSASEVDEERLKAALSHIESLSQHASGRLAGMTDSQIKRERLASRGLMKA